MTARPRAEVLADLVHVLESLYAPENHYQRVALTVRQLKRRNSFQPPARMALKLARSFVFSP